MVLYQKESVWYSPKGPDSASLVSPNATPSFLQFKPMQSHSLPPSQHLSFSPLICTPTDILFPPHSDPVSTPLHLARLLFPEPNPPEFWRHGYSLSFFHSFFLPPFLFSPSLLDWVDFNFYPNLNIWSQHVFTSQILPPKLLLLPDWLFLVLFFHYLVFCSCRSL